MQAPQKLPRLKKARFPQGKSVRVNLKLSEAALKSFDNLKKHKGCKVNAEVFDYICGFADNLFNKPSEDGTLNFIKGDSSDFPEANTRKIFTLNQYTLAKLRNIAKKENFSIDELVNRTLTILDTELRVKNFIKTLEKYSNKNYVFKELYGIWDRVSELDYGLRIVFGEDYYSENTESYETLSWWLNNVETSLEEVDTILHELFNKKFPEKEKK